MSDIGGLYDGREQTLAKHEVLRRYLQRFAFIIGSWSESITYVDCYSGPWDERSDKFTDTSFGIAIEQLRAAKRELGQNTRLRCFFIERDREAFKKLEDFVSRVDDIEIETRNAEFENSIEDILEFVRADPNTFPFFLIDPKGWSIPLDVIRPLLEYQPGEVLITFMLEFIRRFVDHPEPGIQRTFDALYGEVGIASLFKELGGEERDDALLYEYMQRVQQAGGFDFASSSLVLHPQKARTHFNLVYMTRHHRGIEVFKEAEKAAMQTMESARAAAAQRRRQSGGQMEFFGAEDMHDDTYFNGLRSRYLKSNEEKLLKLLQSAGELSYDDIWACGLESPLIWPTDISKQVLDWRGSNVVSLQGMTPTERVPKPRAQHRVRLSTG